MKSPPSYQESRNQFKLNNNGENQQQQQQHQQQQQRQHEEQQEQLKLQQRHQQSDLIYEHQKVSNSKNSNSSTNGNSINFKQYFESLKHAKKRDTPIQDEITPPSQSLSFNNNLVSNSSSSNNFSNGLLKPSYEELNNSLSNKTINEQQKRHKLIKFSNSNSKLQDEMHSNCNLSNNISNNANTNSNSNNSTTQSYSHSKVNSNNNGNNNNNQSNSHSFNQNKNIHINNQKHLLLQQQQKQQSLKFTTEIEKELSNLTLSIEKEMEKQKILQQNKQQQMLMQQQQQQQQQQLINECYGNCVKCSKPVFNRDDAVLAMNNIYHTCCFVCVSCGRQLRGKSFYHLNNQIYCEEDYLYSGFLENAEKCDTCGHIIVDMILQAMGKSYHPGCFRCYTCNECLDGVPFTLDINNRVYCIKDYYRIYAPKCAACGLAITPIEGTNETVRVVSMEKDFHIDCYTCEDCSTQLTDEQDKRCYPLGKTLLCYSCHVKRIELNQIDHILLNNFKQSNSQLRSNYYSGGANSGPANTSSSSSFSNSNNSSDNYTLNSNKKHLQTENL